MPGLAEQVTGLAEDGQILDVATAIVLAEERALIWFGETMARWGEPVWDHPYSEPIGLPVIRFSERVPELRRQPLAATVCEAQFQIGGADDDESFTVAQETEGLLVDDELILDMLRRFAGAYCATDRVRAMSSVVIPQRQQAVAGVADIASMEPVVTIDNRRWQR